ncbi:MAG TPA: 2-phosphosulfolactate phosphatase [Luteibaculaceae bacterium]|nr:2-phosphosulfolactate phosphatase [Luteibaculaceae bacterium]
MESEHVSEFKSVEVCYAPIQFEQYFTGQGVVVVIDVLRATSAICTAFEHGVAGIIPVSTIEEAESYRQRGYLVGAERNGEIVDGFSFGNSPYSYMGDEVKGKTIVLTTTNGTQAIHVSRLAKHVVIGSLINLNAIVNWLIEKNEDVLILCSGWKDKFNLEDTICAGAIAEMLIESRKFTYHEDTTVAARYLYKSAKQNYFGFLRASSHRKRLKKLNLNKDVIYSLTPNQVNNVPILINGVLVNAL